MGELGKENSVCSGVQSCLVKENTLEFDLATLIGFIRAARRMVCLPGSSSNNSQKSVGVKLEMRRKVP